MARRAEYPPPKRFERALFLEEYWDYRPGEHVTILAPSGWGKTTLAFDLLGPLCTPEAPAVILQMKPRDATVDKFRKEHDFRRTATWPPTRSIWRPRKPPGYVLHPRFTYDPDVDDARQWRVFRDAILSSMKRGKGVKVFADETADLKEIGLEREINHALRQGRSLGMGMWSATQRPYNSPSMIYGGAMHLFIGNDPDERSQERYGQIGGVPRQQVIDATIDLDQHEWLYIRRTRGRSRTVMCIVGA